MKKTIAMLLIIASMFLIFADDSELSSLNGKRLGIMTGSSFDVLTKENFPDSEFLFFTALPDLTRALEDGKIDSFMYDEPKSFNRTITTPDFDLFEMNNSIEEFGRSIGIHHSKIALSQLAFEELCLNKLIPELGKKFNLCFSLNYLEVDNAVEISVSHDGKEINPLRDDDLSTLVFSKIAKNLKVEPNKISFSL